MLKYCTRCVMPYTRPDLHLDEEGVCNACRSYESRKLVNWDLRRQELLTILDRYQSNGSNWDCIVPVSGGKDSTYQVVRMLQLGMNPLCVTSTTCDLSAIGRKNIDNVKRLGVDYMEFSPNPLVRVKLNRIGLTEVGDISWPEHVGIFTIPVRAAVQFNVPLIIWGENSQNEYGGPAGAAENNILTRRWLEEFGGLLGLRVSDLSTTYAIEQKHLLPYQYPTDEELQRVGVTGLFLGHYIPWDGLSNALIAQANGLTTFAQAVEGSMVNYENLDNHQTGIHDYFKFLKFGFARSTDIACLHVRRGRITRQDALDIVLARDGKFPWTYLGKPLKDILDPLDLSIDEFIKICDRFTNKKIFKRNTAGMLIKDKHGNLEKLNNDNL
ncbi:N-acetyl sugar amidotransferase [Pseudanabaena galeata UHCC 0370]|jgi:N-acetyl sugar amidotransferase|uniref:N-acetyl sugar amidotransferase n=1 Tax=Pseudanabaena galeata UHCC 0370 TaxID=3110310 RepID=A0ABU5TM90_9CYAN|nr:MULTISPECIES: N-acetyl sugar amidotransferase [Pseudanabaena]MEA5479325.1 N-acetyl sugar amidotransferase [Pseudanabaena galeata UHCC 0370]MEA5487706.1 N-acetyl sugar amidotransferase [Pseudanabaena sp. CCNP1317]WGS70825.1 N-acetyl sugar amidotransferase [Pseudanabaena galeata CCNP1313]